MKRRREIAQRVVVRFLVAQQVPLQLDADVAAAERPDQPIDQAADAESRTVDGGAAGQRDQAADVAVEIVERQRALAFRRRQLHPRQQPAEIAVAVTRRDEDGQAEKTGLGRSRFGGSRFERDGQLGADDGFQPGAPGGKVKARDAVDAVAIEQRQRRIAELGGALHQRFRQRGAVEK